MINQRTIESKVPVLRAGVRLDRYCAARFTYLSREQWEIEIMTGKVFLEGKAVIDPGTVLLGGEMLAYDGGEIVEPRVDESIKILYEDDWFVAIDKTGNLPVHPSGRYFKNTLVFLLEGRYGRKVYPVHRLDRETSGVIIFAFDSESAGKLSEAITKGSKAYLALVHGRFPDGEVIVDLPLGRDSDSSVKKKRKAWPGGTEKARTRFRKVSATEIMTLVSCFPETGRLHQIRAHLLASGFPIVGDKLYGTDENAFLDFIRNGLTLDLEKRLLLPRSALHASRLDFRHPYHHDVMTIRAPLPDMFRPYVTPSFQYL